MILDNLSLTIRAGESTAIVGSTGSGKSTIMRLIYRFYDTDEGTILIDGQDIRKITIDDLRQKIAIVPQDCVLFNDTLRYNIAYGGVKDPEINKLMNDPDRQEELEAKIIATAKKAQIHDFVLAKSERYGEIVGERGLKLSGGEKQRVAIARALLKKTPIMCFDEATSALDTQTEQEIQKAIDEVSKGSTTLIIAHRLSTVMNCDNIIVLKNGVLLEQGNHRTLLNREGEYHMLWNKQIQQKENEHTERQETEQRDKERKDTLAHRMSLRKQSSIKK
jgi:ABC-type multidrug transport system fused ATPase/permease subunit